MAGGMELRCDWPRKAKDIFGNSSRQDGEGCMIPWSGLRPYVPYGREILQVMESRLGACRVRKTILQRPNRGIGCGAVRACGPCHCLQKARQTAVHLTLVTSAR